MTFVDRKGEGTTDLRLLSRKGDGEKGLRMVRGKRAKNTATLILEAVLGSGKRGRGCAEEGAVFQRISLKQPRDSAIEKGTPTLRT